ncbi:VP0952 family biofilm-associated protein [Vibrio proteolyticus]
MVFSTFQFLITTVLAVVCARAISLSEGDIPVLALIIPALWVLPQGGVAGLLLLAVMTVYGLTLPYQPIALSVSVWILFPLMMVVFSRRSSIGVILTTALIVITLQVGIMVTQSAGKLGGSASVTVVQTIAVILAWWATRYWKPSGQHSWWALGLVLPLWLADLPYAALVALCATGIIASLESLNRASFQWSKLLCWTLPTVGFAVLVVMPDIEVPNPVFVVWICLLGTAWMTDYILKSLDENEEV